MHAWFKGHWLPFISGTDESEAVVKSNLCSVSTTAFDPFLSMLVSSKTTGGASRKAQKVSVSYSN